MSDDTDAPSEDEAVLTTVVDRLLIAARFGASRLKEANDHDGALAVRMMIDVAMYVLNT